MRRAIFIAAVLACCGTTGGEATAVAKARAELVRGQVTYPKLGCSMSIMTTSTPVPRVKVVLERADGKGRVQVRTGRDGHFTARVPGSGAMGATVVLDGPELAVTPGRTRDPYEFGFLVARHAAMQHFVVSGSARAGAANIWTELWTAAQAGEKMAQKSLPKAYVRWKWDVFFRETNRDMAAGIGWHSKRELRIGQKGYEWERWPLYHEWAHHVLNSVAPPGPEETAGGGHDWIASYPDRPGLAWSEGFAHAFAAALLRRNGELDLKCGRVRYRLSYRPVSPKYRDQNKAQYNEMAAAAAIWQTATLVGSRNTEAGLGKILVAARDYKKSAGRDPWSMRQARDAIARAGLAGTAAREQQIIQIFQGQDIDWGFGLDASVELDRLEAPHGVEGLQLKLKGPGAYNGCHTWDASAAGSGRPGGLLSGIWDDCNVVDFSGGGEIRINYPYLADQSHLDGPYTIVGTYVCKPTDRWEFCPASHTAHFTLFRNAGLPHFYRTVSLNLPVNREIALVRLSPTGENGIPGDDPECRILIGNVDCSR